MREFKRELIYPVLKRAIIEAGGRAVRRRDRLKREERMDHWGRTLTQASTVATLLLLCGNYAASGTGSTTRVPGRRETRRAG